MYSTENVGHIIENKRPMNINRVLTEMSIMPLSLYALTGPIVDDITIELLNLVLMLPDDKPCYL